MEKKINIMLLSYPRSGSNYLGYVIENFFKIKMKGIAGHQFGYKNSVQFRENIQINVMHFSSGDHLTELKETYAQTFNKEIVKQDGLIVLCRNYHNCINSQYKRSSGKLTYNKFLKEAGVLYVTNLVDFEHSFLEKELLFYEDLVNNIEIILDQLKDFFNRLDKNILIDFDYEKNKKEFLSSINEHTKKSDNFYRQGPGGNLIFRDSDTFHNDTILKGIDNFILSLDPTIYNKYLKQYKT